MVLMPCFNPKYINMLKPCPTDILAFFCESDQIRVPACVGRASAKRQGSLLALYAAL